MFLNNYLYHIFDDALLQVWRLVCADSFRRFRRTNEFEILKKKLATLSKKEHLYQNEHEIKNAVSMVNNEENTGAHFDGAGCDCVGELVGPTANGMVGSSMMPVEDNIA